MQQNISPRQLLFRLTAYFGILFGISFLITVLSPQVLRYLPVGGTDVIELAELEVTTYSTSSMSGDEITSSRLVVPEGNGKQWMALLYLAICLMLTVVIMLPVTWTYAATRYETGFQKTFARALIVLPICATTIVLLIQGNLALAFGLAAMVAAVRFRVALREPIDGIFIFAAICVGLAAGIGFIGIAAIMVVVFCFANGILWYLDYGKNPLDEVRSKKARDKLQRRAGQE